MFNLIKNTSNKSERNILYFSHDFFCDRTFEASIDKSTPNDSNLFGFSISTRFRGYSHAGPEIKISLFGLTFYFSIPKNRHWNYRDNCWLEDYTKWMKQVNDIWDISVSLKEEDFYEYDFLDYYESGYSPSEAIHAYEGELSIDDIDRNNTFCDLYPNFESYYKDCVGFFDSEEEANKHMSQLKECYEKQISPTLKNIVNYLFVSEK